jgi:hypothetical protein
MRENAIENYGEQYRDRVFVVTHTATKYMPASEFYAQGRPSGYHPGYDTGTGGKLYDLRDAETGRDLPFSLYDWEVKLI